MVATKGSWWWCWLIILMADSWCMADHAPIQKVPDVACCVGWRPAAAARAASHFIQPGYKATLKCDEEDIQHPLVNPVVNMPVNLALIPHVNPPINIPANFPRIKEWNEEGNDVYWN
ncbi:hypothetical protein E3N88_39120 [Mikania micrantha]|uniref:Uncharacterized protein n=1 Tax=Mikania micrantha TaxID=192012 RepID=A0A5N6LVV3_9ASTR|nr:hypothetical protein E3N88_39120 [Mikania micrantha]